MPVSRLNHAVLYVRDAERTAAFYESTLGFVRVIDDDDNRYQFMRAPGSVNHHDLAFFTVGPDAGPPTAGRGTVGMYHLAWEVPTLGELREIRDRLQSAGALKGASDHGVNKSLYAVDPDGLEFEVMWLVPAERWGEMEHQAIVQPLDLDADDARYGADLVSAS